MEFADLFEEQRAVSPVIGVILMVAITVILAAVIGTFVLGLGDQVQNTTPRASFDFQDIDDQNVTITHESGDSIEAANLNVSAAVLFGPQGGTLDENSSMMWVDAGGNAGDVSAGDTVTVQANSSFAGETIRLVYASPDSDDTATVAKFEVPN